MFDGIGLEVADRLVDREREDVGDRLASNAYAQHGVGVSTSLARAAGLLDVFEQKLIKRGISLRALDAGEPFASGKEYRIEAKMKEGISSDDAKKISKIIRDEGPKSVKSQIQGDELRVQSKSRDDLQAVIALLKGKDLDVALQFVNMR